MIRRIPARWRFTAAPRGAETFIPRAGDPKRSAAIVEFARRWYRGEATS